MSLTSRRNTVSPDEIRDVLARSLPPITALWRPLALGVANGLCAVALIAVAAWLITRASERPSIIVISAAVVGVRAFALGGAFFRYLERLSGHDAVFRQLGAIRTNMFRRLVPLAPDGVGHRRSGDVLSRFANDVDDLQDYSLRVVQPLVTAGIVAAITVGFVLWLFPAAGVALVITVTMAFCVGALVNRWSAATAERTVAPHRARLSTDIVNLIRGLDVLTAYGALDDAADRVAASSDALTRIMRKRAVGIALTTACVCVVAGAATLWALLLGIPALHTNNLSAPQLTVIALIPLALFEFCGTVPLALGALTRVRASARRIEVTAPITIPSGIVIDAPGVASRTFSGVPRITLRNVSAAWPGDSRSVLSNLNLDLAPGDRVVLTGATGAGKTALAHALTRLIDVTGSYTIDGTDVRQMPQDDVRRVVALCEQRPYLFDSDIRQNILFARDDADDDELHDVLDRVGLTDWVRERGGLDASVGERGALLSGGQAQRIALARILLRNAPVVVVDEPTANVDAERAENIVRDILLTARADGRTVVLITHEEVPAQLLTGRFHLVKGILTAREL